MGEGRPEAPRLPARNGSRPGDRLTELAPAAANRQRRLVFGEVAELYDAARPSYPESLIDDVIARLAPASHAHWLESGAGTGKASLLFANRLASCGADLVCVEPDPAMASVLRRNLAGRPVTVVEEGFEGFATGEGRRGIYSLVYAAQSWHWLDPQRRAGLAADLLIPGGMLALIWNANQQPDSALQAELDEAYGDVATGYEWWRQRPSSPMPHPEHGQQYAAELAESGRFGEATILSSPWSRSYSTAQWLDLLRTHSDHRMLPPEELDAVLGAVGAALRRHGDEITVSYSATAVVATVG